MLVLTRKNSETLRIGPNVIVKVLKTSRGTVKIGIEAPAHVRILRGELCVEPQDEEPVAEEAASELQDEDDVDWHWSGASEYSPLHDLPEAVAC